MSILAEVSNSADSCVWVVGLFYQDLESRGAEEHPYPSRALSRDHMPIFRPYFKILGFRRCRWGSYNLGNTRVQSFKDVLELEQV